MAPNVKLEDLPQVLLEPVFSHHFVRRYAPRARTGKEWVGGTRHRADRGERAIIWRADQGA